MTGLQLSTSRAVIVDVLILNFCKCATTACWAASSYSETASHNQTRCYEQTVQAQMVWSQLHRRKTHIERLLSCRRVLKLQHVAEKKVADASKGTSANRQSANFQCRRELVFVLNTSVCQALDGGKKKATTVNYGLERKFFDRGGVGTGACGVRRFTPVRCNQS